MLAGIQVGQTFSLLRYVPDSCPATKDAIMRLICSHWMKLSKFNPLHFLKSMDILSNDDEAEYVLRVVLSVANEASPSDYLASLSSPEKKAFHSSIVGQLITLEENNTSFTLEQYFLARVAAAYNEEYLTKVVPDMGVLCDVFQQYSRELVQSISEGSKDKQDQSLFVCLQLLQLATLVGMQEEGSRRRFTALLEAILTIAPAAEIPDELIEAAVKALLTLHGVTDGKIKENGMRSRHEDSMISTVLQDIMNHLLELGDDNVSVRPHCTMRILSIFSIILEEAPPTSGIIRDFVKVVSPIILNSVSTSGNDLLREAGVSCLGKLGFFSEKIAVINDYKPLLLALASNEEESLTVRSQAMMALSDWTLVFDEILEPMDSGLSFVKVLNYLLKSTNTSVAAIAAEATAKLLFANRVCDSTLIAFLLVLFFDPITKESASTEIGSTARIQQWLSLFFQAYCLQSAEARDALLGSIETALMLAVTKNVERKKKKVAFPVVKLVEYVCEVVTIAQEEAQKALQLTDAEMAEREEDSRTAFMVALQVAQFVLSAEEQELSLNITQLRGLCKLLGSLSVQSTPGISKLQQIMEELGMVLTDGTSLRSLTLLTQELADLHEEGEKGISGRESNASTLSEVTGCESDASTITEISNKENPRPRSTKVARPSSDSTFSVASSRMTRSVLKSSNMGV